MEKFIKKIQEIEQSQVVSKKVTKVVNKITAIKNLYKAFK